MCSTNMNVSARVSDFSANRDPKSLFSDHNLLELHQLSFVVYQEGLPYIGLVLLSESIVLWLQNKQIPCFNDSFTSLSLGIISECLRILMRGFEMLLYIWVYNRFRLIDLPTDPAWSWLFVSLLVDFGFYWVHRASHEINFLWAHHQVHHSSEDFNLTVGLRHSALNSFFSWILYMPLAFIVPPYLFIIHHEVNIFYQFWMHTEIVSSLGLLDLIFNTPKHHQVHHGRNIYALDKNYGGILILWDRLFGTYEDKRPEELTEYGLVFQPTTFNPIKLQTYYYSEIWNRIKGLNKWQNKIQAVVKSPSWNPGSPWTGWYHLKLELPKRSRFERTNPTWFKCYFSLHFVSLVAHFYKIITEWKLDGDLDVGSHYFVFYLIFSLYNLSIFLDIEDSFPTWNCCLEFFRCAVVLLVIKMGGAPENPLWSGVNEYFYSCSVALWGMVIIDSLKMFKPMK